MVMITYWSTQQVDSVPHFSRVVSIANHFGVAYYHFVVESLVRVTPFLDELRSPE